MKKCRITAIRIACYKDLMEQYENPIFNEPRDLVFNGRKLMNVLRIEFLNIRCISKFS